MEPSADMNPILLKPMGDTTSQVIVNGKPIGKMRASDYYKVKIPKSFAGKGNIRILQSKSLLSNLLYY